MKKLLFLLILIPILGYGQKIKENKIDKFTGQHVIETTQEGLVKRNKWKNQWQQLLISLRYVNGEWVIPSFIELKEIEKYDEDSQLILLLDNNETIILPSLYTGIGSEDCPIGLGGINSNVHGFTTVFPLTNDDIDKLRSHLITDVRISPLGHNYDFEVGTKERDLLQRMIKLIDNNIKNK